MWSVLPPASKWPGHLPAREGPCLSGCFLVRVWFSCCAGRKSRHLPHLGMPRRRPNELLSSVRTRWAFPHGVWSVVHGMVKFNVLCCLDAGEKNPSPYESLASFFQHFNVELLLTREKSQSSIFYSKHVFCHTCKVYFSFDALDQGQWDVSTCICCRAG